MSHHDYEHGDEFRYTGDEIGTNLSNDTTYTFAGETTDHVLVDFDNGEARLPVLKSEFDTLDDQYDAFERV